MSSNSVRRRRAEQRWSQTELAARAGVSRSAISAIEGGRLSPSVTAALALASVLDCTVEDLFGAATAATGGRTEWAWLPADGPARYWEATLGSRSWRYPVEALSVHPIAHDGVWTGGLANERAGAETGSALVLACCDPAAGLLSADYARFTGGRMIAFARGSADALSLLRSGRIHAAGLHYSTGGRPRGNAEEVLRRPGSGLRRPCVPG